MRRLVDLVAIDLDGTLLNSHREISDEDAQAVADAVSAGIVVVLASGRFAPNIETYADRLDLTGPTISSNGAHVLETKDRELAFWRLDPQLAAELYRYAEDRDLHVNAYTRDKLIFVRQTDWGKTYASRVSTTVHLCDDPKEALSRELAKLMFVASPEEVQAHRAAIGANYDKSRLQMTEGEPEYLEFLNPDANKGSGLRIIAQRLGVPQERTGAIGDYLNDIEMLEWAGVSAAMENGHPMAKAVAQRTVFSNDRAGVAQFLHSLF